MLNVNLTKCWLLRLNDKLQENKTLLTELDQKIGDGDHGINMSRGFQAVAIKLSETEYKELGQIFKDTGMTLISKVGGASGPLFGTAFMKISMNVKDKENITVQELAVAFESALEGLKMRGKAQSGDKTMIDVWEPVTLYLREGPISGSEMELIAKTKMEETKELEAKKGRAAYLGKRSVGHIDPGAASTYFLFSTLASVLLEGEENKG
ncbi:dihydroxyacetone kinase subunit DhaL [Sutcliffiella cohnii]